MKKEKLKKICGYSYGEFHYEILFNPYKKHAKYQFFYGNYNLANFDTEEKARMFADAFEKGLEAYSNSLIKKITIGQIEKFFNEYEKANIDVPITARGLIILLREELSKKP